LRHSLCRRGALVGADVIGQPFVRRKPDFALLQSREQAQAPLKIRTLARTMPSTYIIFDIMYDAGRSTMDLPLRSRRVLLE